MDIVERLRNTKNIGLAIEAAQEIERLREVLKKIANGYSDEDGMKNIARAALKEGE